MGLLAIGQKDRIAMICLYKFINFRYDINAAQVLQPELSFSGTAKRVKEGKPFRTIPISRISTDRKFLRGE